MLAELLEASSLALQAATASLETLEGGLSAESLQPSPRMRVMSDEHGGPPQPAFFHNAEEVSPVRFASDKLRDAFPDACLAERDEDEDTATPRETSLQCRDRALKNTIAVYNMLLRPSSAPWQARVRTADAREEAAQPRGG